MVDWGLPKHGWVFVDTNFLIDFFSKEKLYAGFIEQSLDNSAEIVSTDLVRAEFIRSKTKQVVAQKTNFFDKVVQTLLPLDPEVCKLVRPTI